MEKNPIIVSVQREGELFREGSDLLLLLLLSPLSLLFHGLILGRGGNLRKGGVDEEGGVEKKGRLWTELCC